MVGVSTVGLAVAPSSAVLGMSTVGLTVALPALGMSTVDLASAPASVAVLGISTVDFALMLGLGPLLSTRRGYQSA